MFVHVKCVDSKKYIVDLLARAGGENNKMHNTADYKLYTQINNDFLERGFDFFIKITIEFQTFKKVTVDFSIFWKRNFSENQIEFL